MMTLIEFVRAIRANNHRYGAVDKNGHACSCKMLPNITNRSNTWTAYEFIGYYNLTCDWKDTLINVDKIKVE